MNTKTFLSVSLALIWSALPSLGLTVVASALGQGSRVSAASGVALPAGSVARIGSLNLPTDAEAIQRATKAGAASLLAGFTAFSEEFTIGTGAGQTAGRFEIALHRALPPSEATAFQGKAIYLLVLNAPTSAGATEYALLKMGNLTFTADMADVPFLDAQPTLSVKDATVLLGNRDSEGIRTMAFPQTSYLNWATEMLPGVSPANAAPNADPDADGISNQMEYALGGNPQVPDVQILPQIQRVGATAQLMWQKAAHVHGTVQLVEGSQFPSFLWPTASGASLLRPEAQTSPGITPLRHQLSTAQFTRRFWSVKLGQ